MRHISTFLLLCAIAFTACQNDDSELEVLIQQYNDNEEANIKDISFYYGTPDDDEQSITMPANDSVENFSIGHTIHIAFHNNQVEVSQLPTGISCTANGARLMITSQLENVQYIISGTSHNGQLAINSQYKYRLDLNNLTLASTDGPAIYNINNKRMYLVLQRGTINTLVDGNTYTPIADHKMKGALYNRGDIIISGEGTLHVTGNAHNAIATDDFFRLRAGCILFIEAKGNNGIKANDGIFINGSVTNINLTANGGKGLNSEADILIEGGHTTIITNAQSSIASNDTTHCAAVKSDANIIVEAGVLNLLCLGNNAKGMKSDAHTTINGGEVNIVTRGESLLSKPKAIKANADIYINAGNLYAYAAHAKPIDADGTIYIKSPYNKLINTTHLYYIKY